MQKVTIWSIDVFQSCNLLTYFHQAQWHRLYIRIWEHPQKKEKDSRKKNSHSEFKVTKYYLPQSSRSSCRSSGHLRLGDSDSFHKKLLWSSAGDWLFFFSGKNINVYGFINHSLPTITFVIILCSSAKVTEAGRNRMGEKQHWKPEVGFEIYSNPSSIGLRKFASFHLKLSFVAASALYGIQKIAKSWILELNINYLSGSHSIAWFHLSSCWLGDE